jgi:hypothetical protein
MSLRNPEEEYGKWPGIAAAVGRQAVRLRGAIGRIEDGGGEQRTQDTFPDSRIGRSVYLVGHRAK